ncbi:MAG: PAS domain-containing sensor histidine kinase [Halovenus sp.]|uniref:sensor histidine kinase n=1 Tax=Halovenus amylolytica TaxID=2500550 RepID=UPI000FE42928
MSLEHGSTDLAGVASGREYGRLFDVLFEETHDFAFLLEASGLVVRANDQVSAFTGSTLDELVGRRLWNTSWFRNASTSRHQLREDLQRAVGGERIDRVYRIQGRSRTATVEVAIRPVPATGRCPELLLVTGTETTERTRRLSELEAQQECLEEFVRILTHDVRGLLEVATGNLELADESTAQSELTTARESLARIERLLEHCSETVREGKLIGERVEVHLGVVAHEAWQHTDTAEASLVVDSSRTLRADRTRLMEVFENLYRNAVEHGSTSPQSQAPGDAVEHGSTSPDSHTRQDAVEHAGNAVTVRVGTTADGFYIEDDGPGLPDDEAVFEPGVSSSADGSGLGLAITETVVDAHGWSIQATESTQGGARFEIQTT